MPELSAHDAAVLAQRPAIVTDQPAAPAATPDGLQHQALRPILKLLNERLLRLVADTARDYRLPLPSASPADQQRLLDELLRRNARLQNSLTGLVTGWLTAAEYEVYRRHRPEINRRILELLRQRVGTQVSAVVHLMELPLEPFEDFLPDTGA